MVIKIPVGVFVVVVPSCLPSSPVVIVVQSSRTDQYEDVVDVVVVVGPRRSRYRRARRSYRRRGSTYVLRRRHSACEECVRWLDFVHEEKHPIRFLATLFLLTFHR